MYLKYNNSSVAYSCGAENIENDIKITFLEEFEAKADGFKLFSDSGNKLGDYSDYTVIKESYADGFLFSNEEKEEDGERQEETLGEKLKKTEEKISILESGFEEIKKNMEEMYNTIINITEKNEEVQ